MLRLPTQSTHEPIHESIHELVRNNKLDEIKQLLSKTPVDKRLDLINSVDDKYKQTPLAIACSLNREEIVKFLLSPGEGTPSADVSVGGLRMRKSTLDHAKKYPSLEQKVLPLTVKFVSESQKDGSYKHLDTQQKAKVALQAFSLADFYIDQFNGQEKVEHYIKIAKELSEDLKDKKPIPALLTWRMFNFLVKTKQFESAKKSLALSDNLFEAACKADKTYALFQSEMYFDSLCVLLQQNNADAQQFDSQILFLLNKYMTTGSEIFGAEVCIKRILGFAYENLSTSNMELIAKIVTINNLRYKQIVQDNLSSVYSMAESIGKVVRAAKSSIRKEEDLEGLRLLCFEAKFISEITTSDSETAKKLNINAKLIDIHLQEIEKYDEFGPKLEKKLSELGLSEKVTSNKNYTSFLSYLKTHLLPITNCFPDLEALKLNQPELLLAVIDDFSKSFFNTLKISDRLGKKEFVDLLENSELIFKLLKTMHPADRVINNAESLLHFIDRLKDIIYDLVDNNLPKIEFDAKQEAILTLTQYLIECEFSYLRLFKREAFKNYTSTENVSLNTINHCSEVLAVGPFKRGVIMSPQLSQRLLSLYQRALQLLNNWDYTIKLDYNTLTKMGMCFAASRKLYEAGKYLTSALLLATENLANTEPNVAPNKRAASCVTTCIVDISQINNAHLFEKYDESCTVTLNKLMIATRICIDEIRKSNYPTKNKQDFYVGAHKFWSAQVEKLISNGLFTQAIKCSLFIVDAISPHSYHENASSSDNLQTVTRMIRTLILQLNKEEPSKIESALKTIIDVVDHLLDANMLIELNTTFVNILRESIDKLSNLECDIKLLGSLIETIEEKIGYGRQYVDIEKFSALAEFKFMYLESLINKPLNEDNFIKATRILDECEQFYKNKKALDTYKTPSNYNDVMLKMNTRLADWCGANNQPDAALELYNNIIDMCTPSDALSESLLKHALQQANEQRIKLIETAVKDNNLDLAMTLYNDVIENYSSLNDVENKTKAMVKHVDLSIRVIEKLIEATQFNKALQLFEGLQNKIDALSECQKHQPYIKILKEKAEAGVFEQVKGHLTAINVLLDNGSYNQAAQLSTKTINKLVYIEKSQDLLAELKSCQQKAKVMAEDAAFSFNSTVKVSKEQHLTMFQEKKTEPKKKEKKKKAKKKVNANSDQAVTQLIVPAVPETPPSQAVPINDNPQEKKIGSRVTAPFLKKGTGTLFPVLMKNIPEFNNLKKTNPILHRQLKKAVLEGGICQKVGQPGIKSLGDGMWEAKVKSRSRLLGVTVEGNDGFSYIVFSEFSATGLHRSK